MFLFVFIRFDNYLLCNFIITALWQILIKHLRLFPSKKRNINHAIWNEFNYIMKSNLFSIKTVVVENSRNVSLQTNIKRKKINSLDSLRPAPWNFYSKLFITHSHTHGFSNEIILTETFCFCWWFFNQNMIIVIWILKLIEKHCDLS